MKNTVISIPKIMAAGRAKEFFLQRAGLFRKGSPFAEMRAAAYGLREEADSRADLKAVVSFLEGAFLREGVLSAEGETFRCRYFEEAGETPVLGAYAYLVTAGDFSMPGRPLSEQLLADFWGTAYTEAARETVRQMIQDDFQRRSPEKARQGSLSPSLGPGAYGMEPGQVRTLLRLLDAGRIGVRCLDSGVMEPVKTCTGLFLILPGEAKQPEKACEGCAGSPAGCRLCVFGEAGKEKREE